MNITIIGANGHIGSRVAAEALSRGHAVTAVVRDPSKLHIENEKLKVVKGDLYDGSTLADAIANTDVVVSAINPSPEKGREFPVAIHHLVELTKKTNAKRLLVVGGAGSLYVAPNVRVIDTDFIPAAWRGMVLDHIAVRDELAKADINWSYFSPAGQISPRERTGTFRLGTTNLVADATGNSFISTEDYAVALIDELENPQFERQQFTVGY